MVTLTKGWKGYLGGILVIIAGLLVALNGNQEQGLALIGMGLGLLGIRHKLSYKK